MALGPPGLGTKKGPALPDNLPRGRPTSFKFLTFHFQYKQGLDRASTEAPQSLGQRSPLFLSWYILMLC